MFCHGIRQLQFNDSRKMSTIAEGSSNGHDAADEVQPEDSASQVPSSTSSSRRLQLSAKRAALEAEAAFAEQRAAIELEELRCRQNKEALETQVRLASIRAEEEVLATAEGFTVVNVENGGGQAVCGSEVILNPRAAEFRSRSQAVPVNTEPRHDSAALQQLVEQGQTQQRQLLDAIQLPAAQLPTFDGDPLKYYMFIRLFEANVERSTVDSGSRLARLIQYCTGKAKQVIAGCTAMNPDEGYTQARALLKRRFGNDYTICEAWIDKVTVGQGLKTADRQGLQSLSDDLSNCRDTLSAMGCLAEVNNHKTLVKVISRLPVYLQHRWRKEVCAIRRQSGGNPRFEDVVRFVKDAAEEANDPVYGNITEAVSIRQKAEAGRLDRKYP